MTAHRACVLLVAFATLAPTLPALAASPSHEGLRQSVLRQSVLHLPSLPNEAELMVELMPSQQVCRSAWLIPQAAIQPHTLGDQTTYVAGWEGAPPDRCATEELNADAVPGKSLMVAYDSRQPIVLSAPETLQISYRVVSPDGVSEPRPVAMMEAPAWLASSGELDLLTESNTQVASLQDAGVRSDWIREPGEAIPAVPPELLQTSMLPEPPPQTAPPKTALVQREAHLIRKDRTQDVAPLRRRAVTVTVEANVPKRIVKRSKPVAKAVPRRRHRDAEFSDIRRELKRRLGKSYGSRLGPTSGSRLSVFSFQDRGTKVTRRGDRRGNRVLIIQSD